MPPKDMLLAVDSTISKRGHSVSIAVRHGLVDTGVVDTLAEGQRKSQMIYRNVRKNRKEPSYLYVARGQADY